MSRRRILVGHPNLILETMRDVCAAENYEFLSNIKDFYDGNEWDDVFCRIVSEKEFQSTFQLQQMPGCCAVLVVHHVETFPYSQKIFDKVLQLIETGAYEAGFGSVLMAQVTPQGDPENYSREPWALCVGRWDISHPFVNAKSGNPCVYLTRNLEQPGKRQGLEIKIKP